MLTILSQESNYSVHIFHDGHDMGKLKARVTLLLLLQVYLTLETVHQWDA